MGLILPLLGRLFGIAKQIPWPWWAIAAALAWGGLQRHHAQEADRVLLHAQQAAAAEQAQAASAAQAETSRRLAAQIEVTDEAQRKAAAAAQAATAAADAAGRLRQRIAALQASAAASNPAAASSGPADQLAGALAACADRYRSVAAVADGAIIAGQACERAYTSLTPP